MSVTNAMCVWDFTLYDEVEQQQIRDVLKKHCKKYCFQLEKGEKNGKEHWQGRISLKIKKRKDEIVKLLKNDWEKFHISLTSKENHKNDFYVQKEETRINGPYTDENEVYIPIDIRNIVQLKPWQEKMRDNLIKYHPRNIDFVIDKIGNNGKTIFCRYMMLYHNAQILPMCNDYKDLMRMSYDTLESKNIKIFLIDMPRALNKDKLYQFFSGIESLKGGYCYDDRYTFKQKLFDPPRICVFSNSIPDLNMLSQDRWKIWNIKNDKLIEKTDPTNK